MSRLFWLMCIVTTLFMESCSSLANGDNKIIGEWKEYRDNGDTYLLSSYKFNDDGSGLFIVNAMTNTQRVAFTWKKISDSTIEINTGSDIVTLELNNGFLVEHSFLGTIIFKKD